MLIPFVIADHTYNLTCGRKVWGPIKFRPTYQMLPTYQLNKCFISLHTMDSALYFAVQETKTIEGQREWSLMVLSRATGMRLQNFDEILKETLLHGIYANGFEKPSAIQQRAIIPCIKGFDVIVILSSLVLVKQPLLPSLSCSSWTFMRKETQALVLAPTRELAQQVCCT